MVTKALVFAQGRCLAVGQDVDAHAHACGCVGGGYMSDELWRERETELHDALEDVLGNLEDATDMLEKVAQAVWPNATNHDIHAYRDAIRKAREVL